MEYVVHDVVSPERYGCLEAFMCDVVPTPVWVEGFGEVESVSVSVVFDSPLVAAYPQWWQRASAYEDLYKTVEVMWDPRAGLTLTVNDPQVRARIVDYRVDVFCKAAWPPFPLEWKGLVEGGSCSVEVTEDVFLGLLADDLHGHIPEGVDWEARFPHRLALAELVV